MKAIVKEWKEGGSRHHYATGEVVDATKHFPASVVEQLGGAAMFEIYQISRPFSYCVNSTGRIQILTDDQLEFIESY